MGCGELFASGVMFAFRRYNGGDAGGIFFRSFLFPKRSKSDKGRGDNNSVWAIVAGIAKNYNLPFDYVLYDMTLVNVQMYNAVLPSYDSDKTEEKKEDKMKDAINADDPNNKKAVDDFFNKINGK